MALEARQNRSIDPEIADCLLDVMDPEVGVSIVDLGLVYEGSRDGNGIRLAITLTTRACPLGEMIVEDARQRLASRFPDEPRIEVALVWHPPWNPDLITDRGRELLGRQPKEAA
jgi:metal-sulfur cluster biosynthetic enzyme